MYCKNCGKKMPDTAKFCTACGAPAGGGQSTKVMRTLAGADKGKRKNLSWIIAVSSAALVLVIAAAGLFILGMQKKTGFVVRVGFNVEDLEPYEIRYYYRRENLSPAGLKWTTNGIIRRKRMGKDGMPTALILILLIGMNTVSYMRTVRM
ncbi:MAG: zinc-ribbon domain-containing protein [Lachnospiraceae bacterium]|nr:zinc-ribbon domain-containing protein [Lachnospiraceae bacterium]